MIVLYPVVLVIALIVALRAARRGGRTGWTWFAAWCLAGSVFTFSFLTGLSIGLFVLPLAAALLLGTAHLAPSPSEASGLLAGVGTNVVLVSLAGHASGHADVHAPLLAVGAALVTLPVLVYGATLAR